MIIASSQLNVRIGLPEIPRAIDPSRTFTALVSLLRQFIIEKEVPGFIIGISGTDSILTFLACAKAFKEIGRPERVWGIHYGSPFPPPEKSSEEVDRILSINPSYRWVARIIVPWLQQQAPGSLVSVDSSIDHTDDYQRWAALFRSSLNGALKTEPLPTGENYWVVGTKNATEDVLGSYSNLSAAVSLQPIVHLWKSEVLKLCAFLNVPIMAMQKSRQVDCDCGRFDIAANHIEEVDAVLMVHQRVLSRHYLESALAPELLNQLEDFVEQQIRYSKFKKEIPYTPPAVVVT